MALDRYLGDDEETIIAVRHSVAVLVRPVAVALLGVIVSLLVAWAIPATGGLDTILGYVAAIILVVVLVRVGLAILGWRLDRVVVTDRRIFEVSGVLNRNVSSIPFSKVNDMSYRRTVMGRILGFGDFVLETAGERHGLDRLGMIPSPDHFYRTVSSLITHGPMARVEDGPDDDDTGPIPRVIV